MFGRNKNKDGPISPPVKGSFIYDFESELQAAVARRDRINIELEAKNPRKTSGQENVSGGLSPCSLSSLSPATTPANTPATTPSPVSPYSPGFQYSPPKGLIERKSLNRTLTINTTTEFPDGVFRDPHLGPQRLENPQDKTSTVNGANKVESDINSRQSMALDDRAGRSVLSMISKFNTIIDVDNKPEERKKPTTMAKDLTRKGSLKEKATTIQNELTRTGSLRDHKSAETHSNIKRSSLPRPKSIAPSIIVEDKDQRLEKKSSVPPPEVPASQMYGASMRTLPSPISMMPGMMPGIMSRMSGMPIPTSPPEKASGMTGLKEQISTKSEQKLDKKQKKEKKEKEKAEKEKEKRKKKTSDTNKDDRALMERQKKKEKLQKAGIFKPESVFGNILKDVPKCSNPENKSEKDLPEFLVRIIRMIECKIETVGLYRVNGDASEVQHIRFAVNDNKYEVLEKCTNIATLTSTVKLFLREMQEPLINKEMINYFKTANVDLTGKGDPKALIAQLKKSLTHIDKLAISVLHYIFIHAKKVADAEDNKMDTNNMAIVIGPNIVVNNTAGVTDYSLILTEMEMTQRMVEMLIVHVSEVF